MSTDDVIRDREELAEQIRALKELKQMAATYGFDISRPAANAREAVQWLYFGYLAAVKEQNGAAMSLGRTSTFLDVYFERDLAAGVLTEAQAQEIIDDFVIKLRIVRFLRTPEYDELFAGDPTWVTESIGGMGDDGRPLVTKTSFRYPADALQPRPGAGAEPDGAGTRRGCRRRSGASARRSRSTRARIQYESDEIIRRAWGDDGAIACCVSPMLVGKQMQFFGARVNLAKCLLYAINGGRDEISGEQVGAAARRGGGRRARLRRRASRAFERMMDWLAERLRQRAERHPLHARQVRLRAPRDGAARLRAAAHDGLRHRRPVGRRRHAVGDQVREGDAWSATRPGWWSTTSIEGEFPIYGNDDDRVDDLAVVGGRDVHGQAAEAPDLPRRAAHAVGPDDHLERGLRQGDRQHAGRPAARASRSRPGANPMNGRDSHGMLAAAASVAKLPYRDAADGISLTATLVPEGLGRVGRGAGREPGRACSTRTSASPAST